MKNYMLAAALLSASAVCAFAQTAPTANSDATTPAIATPQPRNATAPVEGANSFTEAQAKKRIEEAGFSVKDLKKDDNGIWMATGVKDGKSA